MSGLFGALDIASISTIPEDGTHQFTLMTVVPFHSNNSGNDFLKFNFKLSDPESLHFGYEVTKWIRIYKDMDMDDFEALDVDEKRKVIKNLEYYKTWLTGLGVPEEELDDPDFTTLTMMEGNGYGYSRDGYQGGPREWVLHSFRPPR